MAKIKDSLHYTYINNHRFAYTVRTEDTDRKIILFLHGGPGGANIGMASLLEKKTSLTKYFSLVQYDQRGAGLSYDASITSDDLSIEILLDDTIKFIDFILDEFKQENLILVGHSWGSILGAKLTQLIPNKILAYIGVSQLTKLKLSEKRFTQTAIEIAKKEQKSKFVKQLELALDYYEQGDYSSYIMTQRDVVARLGLLTHKRRPMNPKVFFLINMMSKHYKFSDVRKLEKGMLLSTEAMWDDIMVMDLKDEIVSVDMPVIFISGRSDQISCFSDVDEFYQSIQAPFKQLIEFDFSGHTPQIEEKDKYETTVINFYHKIIKEK